MDEEARKVNKQMYISPQTISTDEKSSFPVNTSFWEPIWSKFSKKAATMEIHCWNSENDVIDQLGEKMKNNGKVNGTETISFTTDLTEEIIDWMRTQSYDARGGLKWFSIFLFDSIGERVAIIGHYGSEIIFYPENDNEIKEIKSFFDEEVTFHIYE
jgi:hypothetical protein